jgi:hypothetical protein
MRACDGGLEIRVGDGGIEMRVRMAGGNLRGIMALLPWTPFTVGLIGPMAVEP